MTTHTTPVPTFGNATFDKGISYGLSWYTRGDTPYVPPTAEQIVAFIRDNMLELAAEGYLDEERLTDNAGFLTGWIVGQYIMEEPNAGSCRTLQTCEQ